LNEAGGQAVASKLWAVAVTTIASLLFAGALAAGYYVYSAVEVTGLPQPTPSIFDARRVGPREANQITPRRYAPDCRDPASAVDAQTCSQWAAVAAAGDYNRLTRAAVVVSYFGFLALVLSLAFTGWAARAAARAANAAEASTQDAARALEFAERNSDAAADLANTSRNAAENELRAWLDVEAYLESAHRSALASHFNLRISFKNVGRTPALDVGLSVKLSCRTSITINGGGLPTPEKYPIAMPSLMPGAQRSQAVGERLEDTAIAAGEADAAATHGTTTVFADVIIYYRTVFDGEDAERRMTSARFIILPHEVPVYPGIKREWVRDAAAMSQTLSCNQVMTAPVFMT